MFKFFLVCACSFRLSQCSEWEKLPIKLTRIIAEGRQSYRQTIAILRDTMIPVLERFIQSENDQEYISAAQSLKQNFEDQSELQLLSNAELIVLGKIIQGMSVSPLLRVEMPSDSGFQSREELRNQLTIWLNELPSEPCLLKI